MRSWDTPRFLSNSTQLLRNFWTALKFLVTSESECRIFGIDSWRCSHNSTLNTARCTQAFCLILSVCNFSFPLFLFLSYSFFHSFFSLSHLICCLSTLKSLSLFCLSHLPPQSLGLLLHLFALLCLIVIQVTWTQPRQLCPQSDIIRKYSDPLYLIYFRLEWREEERVCVCLHRTECGTEI